MTTNRTSSSKNKRHLHSAEPVHLDVQLLGLLARDREETDVKIQLVQDLVEERDRALEQLGSIRELAERSMSAADDRDRELEALKARLAEREARVSELERRSQELQTALAERDARPATPHRKAKARKLEARVAELEHALRQSEERKQQLEATLKALAEAEENS